MAQGILINDFRPEYSENLFPVKALFDEALTVNLTEGLASFDFLDEESFAGGKSLFCFLQSYKTTNIAFNFGSDIITTIKNTGNHIFSFRMLNANTTVEFFPAFVIYAKVWVNGINTDDIEFHMVSDPTTYSKKWVSFCQSINLTKDDEVNFSFYIDADLSYPFNNIGFYIDGLKLEYDDRFLGTPSMYSRPLVPIENYTGWQQVIDTTYTVGSPLTIAQGVTGKIQTGTITTIDTQLPTGVTSFWDNTTDKLIAVNNGDAFTLSLRFKAKMNTLSGYFDANLDIGVGAPIDPISSESVLFTRAANTEQSFDIDLSYFTGTTFISNGGEIQIVPINGDIEIYDIRLVIIRTHKGV